MVRQLVCQHAVCALQLSCGARVCDPWSAFVVAVQAGSRRVRRKLCCSGVLCLLGVMAWSAISSAGQLHCVTFTASVPPTIVVCLFGLVAASAEAVRVTRSSEAAGWGEAHHALERDGAKWSATGTAPGHGAWYTFDLGEGRRLVPTHYTLRSLWTSDGMSVQRGGELRRWVLEGSVNSTEWQLLRKHGQGWFSGADRRLSGTKSASWPVACVWSQHTSATIALAPLARGTARDKAPLERGNQRSARRWGCVQYAVCEWPSIVLMPMFWSSTHSVRRVAQALAGAGAGDFLPLSPSAPDWQQCAQ